MGKFLLDLLQISIAARVGYSFLKWAIRGTKRRKKGIASKIMKLITNKIHYKLDNALKKQKEVISSSKQKKIEYPSNVIPFRNTK